MIVFSDYDQFCQNLAETITWCKMRSDKSDPINCLRTPDLCPGNRSRVPSKYGYYDYHWGSVEQNYNVVMDLAAARLRLLSGKVKHDIVSLAAEMAGGRILAISPEESDTSGLSADESQGFFDGFDLAPWDTWISYVGKPSTIDPNELSRLRNQWEAYVAEYRPGESKEWHPHPEVSVIL